MIGGLIGKGIGGVLVEETVMSYLRPDGDSAADGWTDQAGGAVNIYQAIDESSASDADYVRSPLREGTTIDLTVRLFDGSTEIAEWVHGGIADTFTDVVQVLTAPQYAAITSFSNLFVEFDDEQGNVYRFSLGNPPGDIDEPVRVRYRLKKLAA